MIKLYLTTREKSGRRNRLNYKRLYALLCFQNLVYNSVPKCIHRKDREDSALGTFFRTIFEFVQLSSILLDYILIF